MRELIPEYYRLENSKKTHRVTRHPENCILFVCRELSEYRTVYLMDEISKLPQYKDKSVLSISIEELERTDWDYVKSLIESVETLIVTGGVLGAGIPLMRDILELAKRKHKKILSDIYVKQMVRGAMYERVFD